MKHFFTSVMLVTIAAMVQAQCVTTISNVSNVKCNGQCNGSATATAVGVPNYNYLWQPGGMSTQTVTGLCPNTYTVTVVDGNSCVSSATVSITEPAVLTSTFTVTHATCGGVCNGSITAFPSGGTSPYGHKWNSNPVQNGATASGLCAGAYKDSITDANGCKTVLGPITVNQPTPISVGMIGGGIPCNGGTSGYSTATASGGNPSVVSGYLYSWTTTPSQTTATATGLSSGNYTCTVTDSSGCTGKGSINLTQPAAFTYSASSSNASCATCCNGSATASTTGGTAPFSYLWSNSQNTQTATGLCPGNYTVCVMDANGCTQSSCSTVSVNFTTGILEAWAGDGITISPNPSEGIFNLQFSDKNVHSVKIVNPMGATVLEEQQITPGKTEIDLSSQPNGVYFIAISGASGVSNKKIVLNK